MYYILFSALALAIVTLVTLWVKSTRKSALRRRILGRVYKIIGELRGTEWTLKRFQEDRVPLDAILDFFNLTSPWHDRDQELATLIADLTAINGKGQYSALLQDLATLRTHFHVAGRDPYGWNRTEPGQTVTSDNVFLGNIWGLFTLPVSKWKDGINVPKGNWGFSGEYFKTRNPYDVVSDQAVDFMKSHVESMIMIINRLGKCATA